jgi:2,3,4,5-tetrahydropyridine-2-carboxylate N-succinyltransferase
VSEGGGAGGGGGRGLEAAIERYAEAIPPGEEAEARRRFEELREALDAGTVRAAERGPDGAWRVNAWVKRGILLGFRLGGLAPFAPEGPFPFFEKDTWPLRRFRLEEGVRIVPGGSSVRAGAYLAPGVVCMPPVFVNAGAYVGPGTMIDSHALVGSCAQIGKHVHLSAAAQIGGVLEPVGALPVIIEDDVLVGGNCGVYEGTIVRERAVLAPGTILTGGTAVYDAVKGELVRRPGDCPLEIPAGAVVVPGSRPVRRGPGAEAGISLYTPVIVKYRDEKTEMSARLEELLR